MILQFGQAKEVIGVVVLVISLGVSQAALVAWRLEWGRGVQDGFCTKLKSISQNFMFTQNLRMWCYLEKGLCRCNQLRWDHAWVEWALIQYDHCPSKKRRGRMPCNKRQIKLEWCHCKPRNPEDCWQPSEAGRSKEHISPSEPPEGTSPADTPWFWTCSLQKCEWINFLFF